eukprot:364759-Chlamydomonas_euryale.AAC.16
MHRWKGKQSERGGGEEGSMQKIARDPAPIPVHVAPNFPHSPSALPPVPGDEPPCTVPHLCSVRRILPVVHHPERPTGAVVQDVRPAVCQTGGQEAYG